MVYLLLGQAMLSIADVFFSRPDSTLLVTLTKPVKVLTLVLLNLVYRTVLFFLWFQSSDL